MKKSLLLLFAAFATLLVSCDDSLEVSKTERKTGLVYSFDLESRTAEVEGYAGEYPASVDIPSTTYHEGVAYKVTSIGDYAFCGNSSLTTITIPASVTCIGDEAFSFCNNLTTIYIAENSQLTSIGNYAFSDSEPTAIHIGDIATWCNISFHSSNSNPLSRGADLYLNGELVTKLTIPEGVTSIRDYAFYNCSSLTSITIPESVTRIEDRAFYNCSSLKLVINNSDLPLQGGSSDYGYVAYRADRVVLKVGFIGDYAFTTKDGVHYLIVYLGDDTEPTLPNNYQDENYQIGERAFEGCSSLTTITIPEGVTSIGGNAFYNCSSLTSINIPESMTSIGGQAFHSCSNLTTITIPEGVTSIGNGAFNDCSSLTTIAIPEGVTSIGDYAFFWCSSLTSITLPESVTRIEDRAFYNCSSLTSINIPESVTSIGDHAFSHCSSLTTITIPEGVTSIGSSAFYGCNSLTSITIPASVTSIGSTFISSCSSLTSIIVATGNTIYDSRNGCNAIIETSSNTLIRGCSATVIPEGVTSIGGDAFYNCSSLTSINIPESVTSIGNGAFYNCSSLTAITISEGVTSIGNGAFYNCSSLTSINIPASVTWIWDEAFYNCGSLTSVKLLAVTPPRMFYNTFGIAPDAILYVPEEAVSTYKNTYPWSSFKIIQGF